MKKKLIFVFILVVLVVGVGAFYGGMKYGQTHNKNVTGRGDFAKMANGQRPDGLQFGQGAGGDRNRLGGGMVTGEILSKDDKIITVKMKDGGSKIVLFSESTQVMKTDAGKVADLKVGDNLVVTGSANADGSVTAQMIQLRPNTLAPITRQELAQPIK